MKISELCRILTEEFEFEGDLQASNDACKDYAVRHYLLDTDGPDLWEYFPEGVSNKKMALKILYRYPHVFKAHWKREIDKNQYSCEDVMVLGFKSEVLDTYRFYDSFLETDRLKFPKHIADVFYLYTESALQEKLKDAYHDMKLLDHYERQCDLADIERDLRRAG